MKAIHSLTHREPAPGAAEHTAPIEPHRSARDCCGAKSSGKCSALIQISPTVIPHHCPFIYHRKNLHFWQSQWLSQCCKKCAWLLLGMFWKHKPWKISLWLAKLGDSRTERDWTPLRASAHPWEASGRMKIRFVEPQHGSESDSVFLLHLSSYSCWEDVNPRVRMSWERVLNQHGMKTAQETCSKCDMW